MGRFAGGSLLVVGDRRRHGVDVLKNPARGLGIGDFEAVGLVEGHNQLEGVHGIQAQAAGTEQGLVVADLVAAFDVLTTVSGGGVAAQADAVKMGVARALIEFNAELRKTLKAEGLLTRDARIKERKKYGQKGARKRFQFSKR